MALTEPQRRTRAAEASSLRAEQRQRRRLETVVAALILLPTATRSSIASVLRRAILTGAVEAYDAGTAFAERDVAALSKALGKPIEYVGSDVELKTWRARANGAAKNWADDFLDCVRGKRIAADESGAAFSRKTAAKEAANETSYRLDRIAASDSPAAFNEARRESVRESCRRAEIPDEAVERVWRAELDACEVCFGYNGDTAPLHGDYPSGEEPGSVHAHCLIPGQLVATPTGPLPIESIRIGDAVCGGITGEPRRVTGVSCRPFSGELVVVQANGSELYVTGNHDVLTRFGWAPAEKLKTGDEIFCLAGEHRVSGPNIVSAPTNNCPTGGRKIGIFLSVLRKMNWRSMPMARVNLDSETNGRKREVYVPVTDRELRNREQTGAIERLQKYALNRGYLARLRSSGGSIDKLLFGLFGSTNGIVSRFCEFGSLLWRHLFLAPKHSLGTVALDHAASLNCGCHSIPGHDKSLSDGLDRQPIVKVHLDENPVVNLLPLVSQRNPSGNERGLNRDRRASKKSRNLLDLASGLIEKLDFGRVNGGSVYNSLLSHSGIIAHDCHCSKIITSTSKRFYVGEVFNLEVEGDESYEASGVVVHNCRCSEEIRVVR